MTSKTDSSEEPHYVSPDGDQPISPEECLLIQEGLDLGVSLETIAERLDRSLSNVRRHAHGECQHTESDFAELEDEE